MKSFITKQLTHQFLVFFIAIVCFCLMIKPAHALMIEGNNWLCVGDVAMYSLDPAPTPPANYSWTLSPASNGTITIISATQVIIQWTLPGTCTLTVTDGNVTAIKSIIVNQITQPYITWDNEVGCQKIFLEAGSLKNEMIDGTCIAVCEESEVTYQVHGNLINQYNFSNFDWEVTGGEIIKIDNTVLPPGVTKVTGPGLFQGGQYSEVVVRWGNVGAGFLKVTETTPYVNPAPAIGPALFCKPMSAELCFDIIEIPIADFLFDHLTVVPDDCYEICLNQTVNFKDLSSGSIESPIIFWEWDFGDGSPISHLEQPSHKYTQTGEFEVILKVTNRCGCTNSIKRRICVDDQEAIPIECPSLVCENSIAQYTAIGNCSQYDWKILGGSIIQSNGNVVTVQWDQVGPDGFGYLSLNGQYCDEVCPAWSTIKVPVILQHGTIEGPQTVCINSQYIYKLPPWPATNFSWEILPSGAISAGIVFWNTIKGREHFVELGTNDPGNFSLNCFYDSTITYPGCSGLAASLQITVLDQPEISTPGKICINTQLPCTLLSQADNPANPILQLTGNSFYTIIKPNGTVMSHTTNSSANPYDIPASFFDQAGFYKISVQSLAGEYCDSETITVEVVERPPPPQAIDGETHVCLFYPYEYSIEFLEGTITYWSITGGNINGLATHFGSNAPAIWTDPGAKSLISYREWEDVPGCISTSLGLQVSDISLTGSINSNSTSFYEDNSYDYICNLNNGVLPDVYEWKLTPATAGSITSGQNTYVCTITWLHLTGNTPVTIECKVTRCGMQQIFSYPILVEKSTEISQVNVSPNPVCSGQPVSFEVITSYAAPETFYWNFSDGTNLTSTTNTISHTFTNTTGSNMIFPVTIQVSSSTTSMITASTVEYVTVLPQPNAFLFPPDPFGYDATPVTQTTMYVSVPAGQYTYEWYHQELGSVTSTLITGSAGNSHTVSPLPSNPPNSLDGSYYCVVTDINGCSTTTNMKMVLASVGGGSPPGCTPSPPAGLSAFSYQFTDCATVVVQCTTDENSPSNIVSYEWKINASPSLYTIGSGPSAKDQSPPISFHKAGTYLIKNTVLYDNILPNEPPCAVTGGIYVDIPYVAEFLHSITCNGTNQYSLNLFDYSTIHPGFSGITYQWIVNDGIGLPTISTGPSFTPMQVVAGVTYTVDLVVGDGGIHPNCTATANIPIPNLPVPDFYASTTYPGNPPFPVPPYKSCEEREIYFTNQSTNMSEIISHYWDFGNNNAYSHMLHPMMTYPSGANPTLYYVELTVTDKYGCVVSGTKQMEVFDNTLSPGGPDQYTQNPSIPPPFSICPGVAISPWIYPQYSYTAAVAPTPHNFQWYHESTPIPNCTTAYFGQPVSTSGGYWVQIADQHNCLLNLNPTPAGIAVKNAPTAHIKGKHDLCAGVPEKFTALTGMPASANLDYNWQYSIVNQPPVPILYNTKEIELNLGGGNYILTLQVTDPVGGCSSPVQSYPITVHDIPQPKPTIAHAVIDCNIYELELSCSNASNYLPNSLFNWSNGASGTSTLVYNGGAYRLWVTEPTGCREFSDIEIPYPPDFYFWRFPVGCYDFCPEYLPRYIWPMQWTYGSTLVGFNDWAWKINGGNVTQNGGTPSNCGVSTCFNGYQGQNNVNCGIPCRLMIALPTATPPGEGAGDYTWMLENHLPCAQESDIMQIRINDCCQIEVVEISKRCIQMNPTTNTYEFTIQVNNVPCQTYYNLIIKDNLGNTLAINQISLQQLSPGSNNITLTFDAPINSSDVDFFIEVFCQPVCYGNLLQIALPPCAMKRELPENPEDETNKQTAGLSLSIIPNPAHTLVTFNYRIPLHEPTDPVNAVLLMTDATGRPVIQIKLTDSPGIITTDLTNFTPGVYFVTLVSNRHPAITKKLLIMKN